MVEPVPASAAHTLDCDLCIVGAGIAGMNALFAASRYLTKAHRVVLVERKPRCGGMWLETYDYVRLHQPHPMFTAGNIPWTLGQPPAHLASKPEVLAHFEHCLEALRQKVTLIELYGHDFQRHDEIRVGDHFEVALEARRPDGQPLRIQARRAVKAFGFRVPQNPPLAFTSRKVESVSPHDPKLFATDATQPDSPIYVIGGGKTGMDTTHALLARFPRREITLVVGQGTLFMNRNRAFPQGLKRWWAGHTTLSTFLDLACRFNGDNEAEVFEHFRRRYAIGLGPHFQHYGLGLLSEEENSFIANGVREIVDDYVADIVDRDGVPHMIFRSGAERPLASGSLIVNCTGYVMRETHAYEPYLSAHGTVVSIQPTSSIHILTSFAAYFLVHLMYLGKLETLPLYALDQQSLVPANKQALPFACMTQLLFNLMYIMDAVPLGVMQECGLDFDRLFPLPRRLLGVMRLKRNRDRYLVQWRRALDRLRERHRIEGGVLPSLAHRDAILRVQ